MKKSFDYQVILWKKGKKGINNIYVTVTLTEGENFFMVFYNLMKKYDCNKFSAYIKNYYDPTNYIQYPFRLAYSN